MTTNEDTSQSKGRIVVGVDGSPNSVRALVWAAHQAEISGAPLLAVATWDFPVSFGYPVVWPESVDFEADANRALDDAITAALGTGSKATLERAVIQGNPSMTLEELSRDAEMVVVGSRGHGEVAGMLLGSVSEYLTTHGHCPIVVIRSPDGD
jgi:nucleotide-binding universal stress UspA family protein